MQMGRFAPVALLAARKTRSLSVLHGSRHAGTLNSALRR